jgi:hypothetical protein
LKIAILYFLALSPTSLNILSAIGDSVKKCQALSATAVKNLKRYRRQRLKFFTAVADSAYKNYFENHTKLCSLANF